MWTIEIILNCLFAIATGLGWSWHDSIYTLMLGGTIEYSDFNINRAKRIKGTLFAILFVIFMYTFISFWQFNHTPASLYYVGIVAFYGWAIHHVFHYFLVTGKLVSLNEWIYILTFREYEDYINN